MSRPFKIQGRIATVAALGAIQLANAQQSRSTDSVQVELKNFTADGASLIPGRPIVAEEVSCGETALVVLDNTAAEWTEDDERLFDSYAIKDALGTATATETQLLEAIGRRRDRLANPLTYQQIMRRRRQERLEAQVIEVLSTYVAFFQNNGLPRQKKR